MLFQLLFPKGRFSTARFIARFFVVVLSVSLVIGGVTCNVSYGAALEGVTLPDSVSANETTLVLNGLGIRRATIFKVRVYVMGLYLEKKSHEEAAILKSTQSKRIVMHFVRDVSVSKLRGAWQEGFEKNYTAFDTIAREIEQFQASMTDMKKGEQMVLDFVADHVDVEVRGVKKTSIQGRPFQEALLSIWLGPHPPDDKLKQGILGR
ncbi:MAG: chalcone isomerase family protein [Deltaproteobacteria bacterium]|nr:MAG: chalcone isomerase family protein [Deltaproteobacteria bacterium]